MRLLHYCFGIIVFFTSPMVIGTANAQDTEENSGNGDTEASEENSSETNQSAPSSTDESSDGIAGTETTPSTNEDSSDSVEQPASAVPVATSEGEPDSSAVAQSPSVGESTRVETETIEEPIVSDDSQVDTSESVETYSEEMTTDTLLDLDLEGLLNLKVSIATKTEESLEDAPAIVDVIHAADIERYGYRDVGDVLKHVIGFYLIDDHTIPNLAMRGITEGLGGESGMIKVMIDGHAISYRTTSGNWLGPELIPLSLIKRIEIIRGPASALYGANAFMGVINIVTKSAGEIDGAIVRGEGGYVDDNLGARYEIAAGASIADLDLSFNLQVENTNRGGMELPDTSPYALIPDYNSGNTVSKDLRHDSLVWYGRAKYTFNSRTSLDAYAYGTSIDRGGDYSRWSQLSYGHDSYGRLNETNVSLHHFQFGATANFEKGPVKLKLSSSYFMGGPKDDDRIEVASSLYYIKRQGKFQGNDSQLEVQWKAHDMLTFVGGVEFIFDHEKLPPPIQVNKFSLDEEEVSYGPSADKVHNMVNPGAYIQAHVTPFNEYLKFTGGIRYDYHNIYGSKVTGRAGLVSHPVKPLVLKALYGSAFKAPSANLLYAYPLNPGDVIGNADLKPQLIHTFEVQVIYTPIRYFSISSDIAYNLLLDKAEFVPQGINKTAQNIAEVHAASWETLANFRYKEALHMYLGFEKQLWVNREFGDDGYQSQLVGSEGIVYPDWMLKGGIFGQIPTGDFPIRLSSDVMVVGKRRASDTNILENGGEYYLPVYTMLNGTVSMVTKRFFDQRETTISMRFYNILGTTGPDPGFSGFDYPLAPREIFLSLRQEF